MSVDPLAEKYPWYSPYQFSGNKVIAFRELEGKEETAWTNYKQQYWASDRWANKTWAEQQDELIKTGKLGFYGLALLARIFTPLEDIYGAFTGKDFEGNTYNKGEAVAWAVVSFFPIKWLGKAVEKGMRTIRISFKYRNEVRPLIYETRILATEGSKEIITLTKSGSFKDAMTVTKSLVGDLGEDAKEYIGRLGPFKGKVSGMVSADGKRGFRIDIDKTTGEAHINWWTPKQKGSIPFSGGERQAKSIVDNNVFKSMFLKDNQ